jgi:uncharacterized protein with von Willebrand factor type A (vWA) domain
VRRQRLTTTQLQLVAEPGDGGPSGEGAQEAAPVVAAASTVEQLRHRDVTTLDAAERAQLRRLLAALQLPGERRTTRRLRPAVRGRVDGGRTLRAWLSRAVSRRRCGTGRRPAGRAGSSCSST